MKHPPLMPTAERAFSLIELMLVVAIMAVIAAIAAPRYGDALNRYRADTAAKRIAADLALAQARARTSGSSRSIVFNLAGNSYQLPGEKDLNSPATTYTVNLSSEPYYASLASVSFGGTPTVTFNGYGVPAQAGFVLIQSGKIARTISIDADTGAATVQ